MSGFRLIGGDGLDAKGGDGLKYTGFWPETLPGFQRRGIMQTLNIPLIYTQYDLNITPI